MIVSQLEVLEARQLLTNLIGVHVNGNSIRLTETGGGKIATENDFSIAYTSSQVVLTATNGTSFKVGNQTLSTDTINISGPASIKLHLNRHASAVTISGDGTASLADLTLNLNTGKQSSSVTLNDVIADSVTLHGRRSDDSVTFNQSTVNGDLNAMLGHAAGATLDLESTTVGGDLTDRVGSLTMNQSTVAGKFHNIQSGKNSPLTSTDSTYSGAASIKMGQSGVINFDSSGAGTNHFESSVLIAGSPRNETTVNEESDSVTFDQTPTFRHATVNNTPSSPTLGTPTVNSQTITTNSAPIITGTYDAANTSVLAVAANGSTFTLGTNSQLTSPSSGQWSLNLGGAALTSPVTTVTATSTDKLGNKQAGTGAITDGAGVINNYLTANNLTATTTADGLAYVIKTNGSGALPAAGQTVSVNYSGFLLNSNGTKGTEFDSNIDSQFGHVTPLSFKLGAGQVIKGWDEVFALLPVGTTAELIIPSALAYGTNGKNGSGSSIPPNSILIFDVTVLSAV